MEINLSAFPIDKYFDLNSSGSGPLIYGCSSSITIRQCVQQLFSTGTNNWRSQGVTGVRFFFTLAGGYYSTPFDAAAGNIRPQWSDNLYWFFYDLRSYGIQKVTPTPVFDTWSGSGMQSRFVQSCGVWKTLNFVPWLPYGLDPSDGPNFPDRTCANQSYFNAAQTPADIFWGWNRIFNVIDTVLAKAQAATLVVDALDYYQETNFSFTVEARMIYDNYRGVDVLQELRNRMSWRGFNTARISPSAQMIPPTVASYDCGSYYGDSAMLLPLSQLVAAISGPWAKTGEVPLNPFDPYPNGLPCFYSYDDSANPMINLPVWHSQPTFFDVHSQKVYPTTGETATWAKNFYSDIWAFMQYRGKTEDYVVFGETNPVDALGCSEWTSAQADAMLNGIPGQYNGYKNSTLFANRAGNVVMRPWHRTEYGFACTPSPHVINPPFDPFNP